MFSRSRITLPKHIHLSFVVRLLLGTALSAIGAVLLVLAMPPYGIWPYTLFGRLALNASSWLFISAAYALSGNLWLAALMYANTDYPLSRLVTQQPAMGLLFMALMLVGAWVLSRFKYLSPTPR